MLHGQRGIALIQVLLMTGIISILLLIMIGYAQLHQRQANLVEDRINARFALHSASTDLHLALLSHMWLDAGDQETTNSWVQNWNFYGQPFEVGDYMVSIQNEASLVSTLDVNYMSSLLAFYGVEHAEASRMARILSNWQRVTDDPRIGELASQQAYQPGRIPIQHVRELELLNGWNKDIVALIAPYVTTLNTGRLNPVYLPSDILEIAVSNAQADLFRQMRNEGNFSRAAFSRVTDIYGDEFLSLFPGPTFRIEIYTKGNHFSPRLQVVATFAPYASTPFSLRHRIYQ